MDSKKARVNDNEKLLMLSPFFQVNVDTKSIFQSFVDFTNIKLIISKNSGEEKMLTAFGKDVKNFLRLHRDYKVPLHFSCSFPSSVKEFDCENLRELL